MPALSENTTGVAQEPFDNFVVALTASGNLVTSVIPANRHATVTMNNAGATTFTITAATSTAYPIGYTVRLVSIGAGTCTITGSGVTFNGAAVAVLTNTGRTLVKTAATVWSLL